MGAVPNRKLGVLGASQVKKVGLYRGTYLYWTYMSVPPPPIYAGGGDENAAICEKVAKCENNSTLNVKIDAICENIMLNVKK